MADNKRVRNNRFAVEWAYAKECWNAAVAGLDMPPIPEYDIYETDNSGNNEKLVGSKPIKPKAVTYQGKTYFG